MCRSCFSFLLTPLAVFPPRGNEGTDVQTPTDAVYRLLSTE